MSDAFPVSSGVPPLHEHSPVLTSNGAIDWAFISPEIEADSNGEVKSAPIRVFVGCHHGPNKGYGKLHIEAEHQKEFALCGFESFILDGITGFDAVYQNHGRRVVLFTSGKGRLMAVLEYRSIRGGGGTFYSVVTVFRASPNKKPAGLLVWKRK